MRFESVYYYQVNCSLRRLRKSIVGYLTKVFQAPAPFFLGSHATSEIAPAGIIDSAKHACARFDTRIDKPLREFQTGVTLLRIRRNNVSMGWHTNLDNDVELEIGGALPNLLCWEAL